MASPGAAGTALLIRQYFMDPGTAFWKGNCNRNYLLCNSLTPSGVLIKAIILHSGTAMIRYDGGRCSCGLPTTYLIAPPDSTQGYGRINLSNVLPLQGKYVFDLFIDDLKSIAANSQVIYHAHLTTSNVPLK